MKHDEAQLKQILSSVKKNNEKNATIAPHAPRVQQGLDHGRGRWTLNPLEHSLNPQHSTWFVQNHIVSDVSKVNSQYPSFLVK